jgi:hypothetical protein
VAAALRRQREEQLIDVDPEPADTTPEQLSDVVA